MVGSLKLVGEGRWSPERIGAALLAADRREAGPTAPPDGLILEAVTYDGEVFS
jgi:tRNA pseudouridine38-40 synthase